MSDERDASPDGVLAGLPHVVGTIRDEFDAQHGARERALAACRRIVQHSAQAIRAVHRREYDEAQSLIDEAATLVGEASGSLHEHAALYHAGFLHDAIKEFAEAKLTLAMVREQPLPTLDGVGVDGVAYLHGLAEAAGELRRFALDSLRRGEFDRCERLLAAMDEIYGQLVTLDYPDAITRGLRRTTDMVRGVTERTRGDLTTATLEQQLQAEIRGLRERLDGDASS